MILKAHKALETITLTKDVAHFKPVIEKQFSEQVYNGLWFSPLTDSLKQFIDSTQRYVEGDVRVKLFKGNAIVNGRQSPYTLYDEKLATYTKEDAFNQKQLSDLSIFMVYQRKLILCYMEATVMSKKLGEEDSSTTRRLG